MVRAEKAESELVLPSRRGALSACRDALGNGPVLLTGAAGVGKTWLGRLLAAEDGRRRWVCVDAAPGMTAEDFLRAFAAAIGADTPAGSAGTVRLAVREALRSATLDGGAVALVLDEAHLPADDVLEEVRLLANRLGRDDGLAALVVSGQTTLARRLDSRSLDALESRLAARVHLLPLDLDEAAALLESRGLGLARDRDRLETLHRDVAGNPSRLLRQAIRLGVEVVRAPAAIQVAEPPPAPVDSEPMIPVKPPLRVEEGLIEVGWDSENEPDGEVEAPARGDLADDPDDVAEDDEPIEDHYAALQAWGEWSRNQGRGDGRATGREAPPPLSDHDELAASVRSPLGDAPGLWVEGRQAFGPYSQLFSRLRPLQDAE